VWQEMGKCHDRSWKKERRGNEIYTDPPRPKNRKESSTTTKLERGERDLKGGESSLISLKRGPANGPKGREGRISYAKHHPSGSRARKKVMCKKKKTGFERGRQLQLISRLLR